MTAVPLRLIDDIGMRKLTSAAAKDLMEDPCWLLAPSTRTIRASASGLSVSAD